MGTKNILLLMTLGAIFALSGCNDDDDSGVYILNSGTVISSNFTINDEPYEQTFNVALTGNSYPLPSSSGISGNITVYLDADEAKVEAYNTEKGTSYEVLPAGSYSFDKETVISPGNFYSDTVTLSIAAKGKIDPFVYYMLPISIESVTGASADVCHQTIYFLVYGSYDASDMQFLDRSLWTVVEVSSEELTGEGANNGHATHAFDSDGDTFWHTQWSGNEPLPPHHIIVDMGKEETLNGFSYLTRDFGGNWPKACTIYVSADRTNWAEIAIFTGLPGAAATEFRSFFPNTHDARYFKLVISAVYTNGTSTHVSEINMF